MTLSARRIAVQGFGFAALAVAVQGFTTSSVSAPPPFYGGGSDAVFHGEFSNLQTLRTQREAAARARRIHAQNQAIVAAVLTVMTEGLFE